MTTRWLKPLGKLQRADLLALASILIFFIALFWWALFGGGYLMSGDSLFYTYPLRTIAWQMIRAGQLPSWSPEILSGYPMLSMAQLALAYPITWGYLFLPPVLAEKICIIAPFLLAPIFTYAYLRSVNRSTFAALLGALAFVTGGLMVSPISNNGMLTNAFMWLPLFLLVIERSRTTRLVPSLVAASVIYALSVLTGFAQVFIAVGLVAAAYSLWLSLFVRSDDHAGRVSRWHPVIVTATGGVLAIGIAAFQVLETARVVRRSVRSTLTYQSFIQGSFPPIDAFLSFTTPLFHVIDVHTSVIPLAAVLAAVAVVAHLLLRNFKRDMRVPFWFIVAIVSVLFILGGFTPLFQIVYHIPVLNMFRVPSRHTAEWTFAVSVLSAYGWDALAPRLRKARESRPQSNLTSIYAAIVLLAIGITVGYFWWNTAVTLYVTPEGSAHTVYSLFKVAMAIILAFAIWRASLARDQNWRAATITLAILVSCFVESSILLKRWWRIAGRPVSAAEQPTAPTRFLQQFPASGNRVYTRVTLMSEQAGNPLRLDAANLSGMFGLQDVAGYEPLTLQRYSTALGRTWLDAVHPLDGGPADASLFSAKSHVLDLLNVTHVVSYRGLTTSLPEAVAGPPTPHSEFWQPVFTANDAVVMSNNRALPRAWLVGEAQSVRMEVALSRIRGEDGVEFDPRRTALVETNPNEIPQLPGGPLPEGSEARVVAYEPNHIVIQTKSTQPAVLVVSELFYPGWEAWVDDKATRIQIANYLLRGVFLPAGEHKIEMRYTAPAFRNGVLISLATLGLLTVLSVLDLRKQRLRNSTN